MTHGNNFIAVIKSSNAILREHDSVVTLPFGSEYSILLKNLNSHKVTVNISIDGQDVLNGKNLVIDGNSDVDIKGFLSGDTITNKFKFIQKTQDIVKHRGDKIDDGVVRIEYTFEKEKPEVVETITYHHDYCKWGSWLIYPHIPSHYPYATYTCSKHTIPCGDSIDTFGGSGQSTHDGSACSIVNDGQTTLNSCNMSAGMPQISEDEGITVHGSQMHQQLNTTSIGELEEQSNIITLLLRGIDSKGAQVEKPIEVKTKLECPTCSRKNKSNNKYCSNCGTCLI